MNTNPLPDAPNPPTAPPTVPGPLPPPSRTIVWPTIIGVITVVFGAIGVLFGIWAMLAPLVMPDFTTAFPQNGQLAETMKRIQNWNMMLLAATAVFSLILLAGGIGLLQRRPWAPLALKLWAPFKIAAAIVTAVFSWLMQQEILRAQSPVWSGTPGGAAGVAVLDVFAILGVVVQVLWGAALPVFVLIWFTRRPIRQQVAQWSVVAR